MVFETHANKALSPVIYLTYTDGSYIMSNTFYQRLHLDHTVVRVIAAVIVFMSAALTSRAQSSATDGATPAVLQPGAPAGSYALSGLDNVNLYNGNLNFRLPLGSVIGTQVRMPI